MWGASFKPPPPPPSPPPLTSRPVPSPSAPAQVYVDKEARDGAYHQSKLLWALGNFSRFLRPGAQRLTLPGYDARGLPVGPHAPLLPSTHTQPMLSPHSRGWLRRAFPSTTLDPLLPDRLFGRTTGTPPPGASPREAPIDDLDLAKATGLMVSAYIHAPAPPGPQHPPPVLIRGSALPSASIAHCS